MSHSDGIPQIKFGNERELGPKDEKNMKIAESQVAELATSRTTENKKTRLIGYRPPMPRHRFGILIFRIKILNRKIDITRMV